MSKKLIVTADDFGFSIPVNEAVEAAHLRGVLTTASLMISAGATGDALDRARRIPNLRVGLHLVLVNGWPVSLPESIPNLLDSCGQFPRNLFRAGVSFFFRPSVREQLAKEIRAQFQAFQETGLPLDHVNCHNHMHLHPTVASLLLEIGREYGLTAVRLPYEPALPSWRASRKDPGRRLFSSFFLRPWLGRLRAQLRRARVRSNQFLFGMNDSGKMETKLVLRFLQFLPAGVSEMYFHPAARFCPELDRVSRGYRSREEFAALTDPSIREFIRKSGIHCTSFSDL